MTTTERREERRQGNRRLLYALAVASVAWGTFAALLPDSSIVESPAWSAAVRVMPWRSQGFLGAVVAVAGLAASLYASRRPRLAELGALALPVAASVWALVGASFGYAATQAGGVGAGFGILCTLVAWLYLRLSWLRSTIPPRAPSPPAGPATTELDEGGQSSTAR